MATLTTNGITHPLDLREVVDLAYKATKIEYVGMEGYAVYTYRIHQNDDTAVIVKTAVAPEREVILLASQLLAEREEAKQRRTRRTMVENDLMTFARHWTSYTGNDPADALDALREWVQTLHAAAGGNDTAYSKLQSLASEYVGRYYDEADENASELERYMISLQDQIRELGQEHDRLADDLADLQLERVGATHDIEEIVRSIQLSLNVRGAGLSASVSEKLAVIAQDAKKLDDLTDWKSAGTTVAEAVEKKFTDDNATISRLGRTVEDETERANKNLAVAKERRHALDRISEVILNVS